ncbi:MAG TPA: MerR family transcriptional regulator [Allosphingosinicella sp.]|jgi:DNA-binding transcriptional MerR regulator
MAKNLDIAEVVRRTGLSARALRFYEARGLLKPLRTASGRRVYGPAELEEVNRILALKKAGLTLAQIQRLGGGRPLDLEALVAAQLEAIEARSAELAKAKTLLTFIQSRIERGEPIDSETFCSLIRNGDTIMEAENWKQALERHYSPEELAHWSANPPPAGFDQAAYSRSWEDLGERIEAALPLDPAGERAQAFVREWNALLEPFRAVATPQMMEGAKSFWESGTAFEGQGGSKPPFSKEAMQFILAASAAAPEG